MTIAQKPKSPKRSISDETVRVSRHETTSFDKDLFLFCQVDLSDESLFSVCQTSQDQTLIISFLECPTSIKLYKMHSSHT